MMIDKSLFVEHQYLMNNTAETFLVITPTLFGEHANFFGEHATFFVNPATFVEHNNFSGKSGARMLTVVQLESSVPAKESA